MCLTCGPAASICSSASKYYACANGYYTIPVRGGEVACAKCLALNAATCFANTVVTSCNAGYYLPVAGTAMCLACPTNGKTCNSVNVLSCMDGYFV